MRSLGFFLSLLLILLGAGAGMAQIFSLTLASAGRTISIGSVWAGVNADGLLGFQAFVENRLSPDLWPLILMVLIWPAWVTLLVPGALLAAACRPNRRGLA